MTTITIREQPNNTQNEYQAISFNNDEFPCTINNPCTSEQVSDLEWYFKEYPYDPDDEDQERAKSVAANIKKCGTQLFEQVFCNRAITRRYDQEKNTGIQCIEIIGSPAFHSLPWETLHDPEDLQPLALELPIVRQYTFPTQVLNVRQSPIINLLIVTARPHRENDIDYRAISRPLVDSLRQASLRVNINILRPGTYRALKNHLSECQNGYYHIIHLDVHGALEGDNSFVYLDSAEEDNRADPIEATQLAQLLVRHQIPITILNTCESGKQVGLTETSLSGKFMEAGMPLVLAMRYRVTVGAATFFMKTLYQHLFGEGEWHNQSNHDIATAICYARKTLYNNKERRNTYNEPIELEEWIIPVVYQNTPTDLPLRDFRPDEQAQREAYDARTFHQNPAPPDQFIGRDLELLEIETQQTQRNILLIRGGTGIGKTTLLHHLAWWWQNTYAVDKVFYFGYDEKPWTHQQVLQTIAQPLFGAEEPQGTVVNRLVKERHLLIFDALEHINEPEKTALHDLLMRLVYGKSLILLGSQSDVKWLAKGTFGDNIYRLSGIDNTSANILMESTLKRHKISYNDDDIRTFYLQVEKNPLLLEIVTRAILKKQTLMLSALQTAMTETDSEAKQQSILHAAIHFIYNTLAPDEQGLLLCLAPLKFAININMLPKYSQQLQQKTVLAHLPFNDWEKVLDKVADWELLRLYPDVLLQSAFADFLRSCLGEKVEWQGAIENAFVQYCDKIFPLQIPDEQGSLSIFKPLKFTEEIEAHLSHFVGRNWILKQLNNWLADCEAAHLYLIVGNPGVGKTALAAFLCNQYEKRKDVIAAFHFCRYYDDICSNNPQRIVMSLIGQLSLQLPDYQQRLVAMNLRETEVERQSFDTLFQNFIIDPLRISPPDKTILIIIDALDEATHHKENTLAHFMGKFMSQNMGVLPWLRFIITSRPVTEVRHSEKNNHPFIRICHFD